MSSHHPSMILDGEKQVIAAKLCNFHIVPYFSTQKMAATARTYFMAKDISVSTVEKEGITYVDLCSDTVSYVLITLFKILKYAINIWFMLSELFRKIFFKNCNSVMKYYIEIASTLH